MDPASSDTVKQTLSSPTVHEQWERSFRSSETEAFYNRVFDWIGTRLQLPSGSKALDAGCGIGQHSIRLARQGMQVVGADFSADRVAAAIQNIERQGYSDQISFQQEDLVEGLSFQDRSFDLVLCWGVLMHIPQHEVAMKELVRVTRPGGFIVISEGNALGLDEIGSLAIGLTKRIGKSSSAPRISLGRWGVEYWARTESGPLFIRHARISEHVRFLEANGCVLRHRVAGQLTERYASFSGKIASLLHWANNAWFTLGRVPYLATANLLVFERRP